MTRPSIAAPAIALSIQQEKDGGLSHSATVNLPKWAEMHHFVYFHWDYIWLIHWLCSVQRDCRWNIVSGWLTDPEATCGSVISPPMNSVIYLPIYHFLIDPNVHNHIFFFFWADILPMSIGFFLVQCLMLLATLICASA